MAGPRRPPDGVVKTALLAALWLAASAPAAAQQFDVLRPLPKELVGRIRVDSVDVSLSMEAGAAMIAHDAKAAANTPGAKVPAAKGALPAQADYDTLPFTRMAPLVMTDVTRAWGLTDGRPVRLAVTVFDFATANAGRAMLGGTRDTMTGLVEVRDASDRRMLAMFTVKVVNRHFGWTGMLIRGGGVRERLVEEFALETSRVLSGRKTLKSVKR